MADYLFIQIARVLTHRLAIAFAIKNPMILGAFLRGTNVIKTASSRRLFSNSLVTVFAKKNTVSAKTGTLSMHK